MIPYRTTAPTALLPIVTVLLIVANAAVMLMIASMTEDQATFFVYTYGLVPAFITDPALAYDNGLHPKGLLTLLSNAFLHGGLLHLVLNMWTLWLFGGPIEGRLGGSRFLFFYLACGIAGSAGHLIFNLGSTVPAVGASGAIAGVLGGFMLLYPRSHVALVLPIVIIPFFFQVPAVVFATVWFFIQLSEGWSDLMRGGTAGGIAWWAHIFGFITGMVLVRLIDPWRGSWQPGSLRHSRQRGPWG